MSAKTKIADRTLPELREFVQENANRLCDFCLYLLPGDYSAEELVLNTFREFGDVFRKSHQKQDTPWGTLELRIRLFALAWEKIKEVSGNFQFSWALGRDTRQLKGWDSDLLQRWQHSPAPANHGGELPAAAAERLRRVDLEVRAPVVLRDILHFEDEEAVRILGIRWGVYRHRLHRGRLDFRELLHGYRDTETLKTTRSNETAAW